MHTHAHKNKAFTLIELLVVIAIIGILSAVVLASLNTARAKGQDATIESDIDNLRTQAQIYYNDNNNFGTNAALESQCDPTIATDDMFGNDQAIENQVAGAEKQNNGAGIVCNVDAGGASYAVSAALVATPGTYYCADSTNVGTTTTTALGATATHC